MLDSIARVEVELCDSTLLTTSLRCRLVHHMKTPKWEVASLARPVSLDDEFSDDTHNGRIREAGNLSEIPSYPYF